jgi:hypothetical protein
LAKLESLNESARADVSKFLENVLLRLDGLDRFYTCRKMAHIVRAAIEERYDMDIFHARLADEGDA